MHRHRARHTYRRADRAAGRAARRRDLLRHLCRWGCGYRPRCAARLPPRPRRTRHGDRGPAAPAVGGRETRRGGQGRGLRREAAQRALDQRGVLLLRAGRARLHRRGQRAGAGAAGAPRSRRAARRLPPRGVLGLHGHLQGCGRAQRSLGGRRSPPLDGLGQRRWQLNEPSARHRRPRLRRLALGAGAAGARRHRARARSARSARWPTSAARAARASTCSGCATRSSWPRGICATPRRSPPRSPAATPSSTWRRRRSSGSPANRRLETLEVNVRGAWNVFEACREHGVAAGRLRLLRQGLRRQSRAALPGGLPAASRLSL